MALDIGLGGGGRPVPTTNKPTLTPVPIPSTITNTTPSATTTTATAYLGYYYEIAQNLSGAWMWAVYSGVQQSWGLELILVSGGTSENYDDALFQVTSIIDNLTQDSDYTAPIEEDASVELVGLPDDFPNQPVEPLFQFPPDDSAPIYEMGPQVGGVTMVRIVGIAVLYYALAALNRKW